MKIIFPVVELRFNLMGIRLEKEVLRHGYGGSLDVNQTIDFGKRDVEL
jgi:hypothetical protein